MTKKALFRDLQRQGILSCGSEVEGSDREGGTFSSEEPSTGGHLPTLGRGETPKGGPLLYPNTRFQDWLLCPSGPS